MKIKSVKIDVVAVRKSQYPLNDLPEFLLVGRSNVGKSSFINALINRKNLAHTSSTPGKTRTLNFYLINEDFYLVDVPGYGYAEVSRDKKKKFGMMIEEYIGSREDLKRVFLLIDVRHKPTEDDVLMYDFLKYYNIPTTVIVTKKDKLKPSKLKQSVELIKEKLDLVVGDNLILFSSETKEGREEVLELLDQLIKE